MTMQVTNNRKPVSKKETASLNMIQRTLDALDTNVDGDARLKPVWDDTTTVQKELWKARFSEHATILARTLSVQNYKALSYDDVMTAIRPLLQGYALDIRLVAVHNWTAHRIDVTTSRGQSSTFQVSFIGEYEITHIFSGTSIRMMQPVTAENHSDKAAFAAATMGLKYLMAALFFSIRFDDTDPELINIHAQYKNRNTARNDEQAVHTPAAPAPTPAPVAQAETQPPIQQNAKAYVRSLMDISNIGVSVQKYMPTAIVARFTSFEKKGADYYLGQFAKDSERFIVHYNALYDLLIQQLHEMIETITVEGTRTAMLNQMQESTSIRTLRSIATEIVAIKK